MPDDLSAQMMPSPAPPPATAGAAATPAADPAAGGLELSDEDLGAWRRRLAASTRFMEQKREQWKGNMRAYMAKVLGNIPEEHVVNVPIEFSFTELKKAQLVFQVPEVSLKPRLPGLEQAVRVFQGALNYELGDDAADAKALIDETTMDLLICGVAASKIAYVAHQRTRQVPVMVPGQPDPVTGQPGAPTAALDPETGEPQTQDEAYLALEEYRWDRFPAEDLRVPSDFESARFDRAPWLAMRVRFDQMQAKREGLVPENYSGGTGKPRETLSSSEQPDAGHTTTNQVEGYEIWMRADVYDAAALPGQYRKLILIDNLDKASVYEDSRYQYIDAQDGKLKGMKGNPIHPLTIRFLPGSPFPQSDVEMSRPLSEELSTGRTQMMQFRDRVLPRSGYNRQGMDPETLAKLESGKTGAFIGFDGDPDEIIKPLNQAQYQRENFTFDQVVRRDVNQTWAVGATPAGQVEPEARTATEVQNAQGTADVRLDNERTWFLGWFCRGARKFGALLQQFKDDPGYAEIVGADGVQQLQAWDRHHIQGEFVFQVKPDSALRLDANVERQQALALYNLTGKDPNVNRVELLKTLFLKHNIDPGKIVVQTPPPQPHPEPVKVNLSLKGDDLSNPLVLAFLQQEGFQIPSRDELLGLQQAPPAPGAPQSQPSPLHQIPSPPHPGAASQMEPLSKHALVQSQPKLM